MKLKNLAWFPKPNEVPYCFFDGKHFHQQNWPWRLEQIYSLVWASHKSSFIAAFFAQSSLYDLLIRRT